MTHDSAEMLIPNVYRFARWFQKHAWLGLVAGTVYLSLGYELPGTPSSKMAAFTLTLAELKVGLAETRQQLNTLLIKQEWSVQVLCSKLTSDQKSVSTVPCPVGR